jgi:SAM-dependent methyltransferase
VPELLYVNPDVLFRLQEGVWLLSNPRLRTHLELSAKAGEAVGALGRLNEGAELTRWVDALKECSGFDRTEAFFGAHGLHTDHSGLAARARVECVGAQLVALLCRRLFLISNREQSLEMLKPLENVFDRSHLGNFHQRVGQYLTLEKRSRKPWRDWHDQKFSPDGRALRPGPYREIQEYFFDHYFSQRAVSGQSVLDFGCGNGYYSSKFANQGAVVLALDSSDELLQIARANYGQSPSVSFVCVSDLAKSVEYLKALPERSLDIIYLQDTLLLLLTPDDSTQDPALPDLIRAFGRLLAPGGRLMSMEPNAVFWLSGRYGDPQCPYAIVTEYRHSLFNVAPTLDKVLPWFSSAGMALVEYDHPLPRPGSPDREFIQEFPIWDFLVFGALA